MIRQDLSITPESVVLAVDGGGVKTDLALIGADGRLLSLVRGGGSSSHYLGLEGTVGLLEQLLGRALDQAGLGGRERPLAATAQILLAGADLPEELSALRARLETTSWSERLRVDNDTLALLRAGTDRGWGIAVVCGAGINCLGRAPDGREVRFLSLGEISGDWGGGTDVGQAALFAAARSVDGRGPRTALELAVPEHFGLSGPLEVTRALHLREIAQARLGELTRVVFALSDEDEVAASIVHRLAGEVVAFARAVVHRLELSGSDPDVVLGGSLLRALPSGVVESISRSVRELAPEARVIVSPSEPIVGAALLGLDALGADAAALSRARAELDEAARAVRREGGGGATIDGWPATGSSSTDRVSSSGPTTAPSRATAPAAAGRATPSGAPSTDSPRSSTSADPAGSPLPRTGRGDPAGASS